MKNNPFSNKKGTIEASLTFLIKLILLLTFVGSATFIFSNIALADIKAQNAARNFGTAFNALALTTKEATIDAQCPEGVTFIIEQNRIIAKVYSSIGGGGFATYHYMYEKEATLPPKTIIDCSAGASVEVSKKIDENTLKPVISVS